MISPVNIHIATSSIADLQAVDCATFFTIISTITFTSTITG